MLLSCENNIKEIRRITTQSEPAELHGKNIEYTFTDSTRLMYKIQAPEFIQQKMSVAIYVLPKGGNLTSFDKEGNIIWKMKAGYAKSTKEGSLWEFRNNVEAVSSEGKTINTELMYWDQKKGELYSDKYVRIAYKDGQILEGSSFSSDEKFETIRLSKVTGTGYLNKNE